MLHSLDQILTAIYFWGFASAAVLCAFGILFGRHPLNAAICLIGTMLSLAGIYALLASPFLAVLQVLVYAGAVMMLVLFVIMVLNQARDHVLPRFDKLSLIGAALPVLIGVLAVATVRHDHAALTSSATAVRAGVEPVATALFAPTKGYYLLFELVGVLLLVAVVGAVLLAKRRLDADPGTTDHPAGDAANGSVAQAGQNGKDAHHGH